MEIRENRIRKEIQTYFKVPELVCPHVYQAFGGKAIEFFRVEYLETILFLRRHFNVRMFCNYAGMTERGARCNRCEMVQSKTTPYLSAHVLWCGGDWTFEGYEAGQIRAEIKKIAHMLPYPIRLEKDVKWVHIDTSAYCRTGKITEFNG